MPSARKPSLRWKFLLSSRRAWSMFPSWNLSLGLLHLFELGVTSSVALSSLCPLLLYYYWVHRKVSDRIVSFLRRVHAGSLAPFPTNRKMASEKLSLGEVEIVARFQTPRIPQCTPPSDNRERAHHGPTQNRRGRASHRASRGSAAREQDRFRLSLLNCK